MRRNEHELTDQERIDMLIGSCQVCRLGFVDGDRPYIVPLNFGYAREGRKMDLARRNGTAGFELDTAHELHEGDAACSYSFRYQSVIGSGTVRELTDPEEKRRALTCIMEHYTEKTDWEFPDAALGRTAVLALTVEELAAKVRE